jgi:hypothetical protein
MLHRREVISQQFVAGGLQRISQLALPLGGDEVVLGRDQHRRRLSERVGPLAAVEPRQRIAALHHTGGVGAAHLVDDPGDVVMIGMPFG